MRLLNDNIEELYKVQQDKDRRAGMEDLSHAYGLLLHSTGVKTLIKQSVAVPRICEMVSIHHGASTH